MVYYFNVIRLFDMYQGVSFSATCKKKLDFRVYSSVTLGDSICYTIVMLCPYLSGSVQEGPIKILKDTDS